MICHHVDTDAVSRPSLPASSFVRQPHLRGMTTLHTRARMSAAPSADHRSMISMLSWTKKRIEDTHTHRHARLVSILVCIAPKNQKKKTQAHPPTCSLPQRTTVLHSITSPRNRTLAPILSIFLFETAPAPAAAAAAALAPAPPAPLPAASPPARVGLDGLCSRDLVAAVLPDLRLPPRLLVELLDRWDRAGELSAGESSSTAELLLPNLRMLRPRTRGVAVRE